MKSNSLIPRLAIGVASFAAIFAANSLPARPSEGKDASKAGKSSVRSTETREGFGFDSAWLDDDVPRPAATGGRQYPWKYAIVTTTFWIGEHPSGNNPTPNYKSCWDARWTANYGGDDPSDPRRRTAEYAPAGFTPRQNPFYIALPYNDLTSRGHKAEASQVIPWFKSAFQGSNKSVCKGRWVAIRKGDRVCYAQWEDAGPFRTDHWEYVFGNERPRANINGGAGLDVSPAVRDFLGLKDTDVTDWKFVEFVEVPKGPWAMYGDNNTFVQNRRAEERERVASDQRKSGKAAE